MCGMQKTASVASVASVIVIVANCWFLFLLLLTQDYDIQDELGKGGFAVVYRAQCRKSGFAVAIKKVNKSCVHCDVTA